MDIRKFQLYDLKNGFLETLNELADTSTLTFEEAKSIYVAVSKETHRHIIVAQEYVGDVIGTGSIYLEKKFIHNGGIVGHVEDVVVRSTYKGQGVGKLIMEELVRIAESHGAYKVILDCSLENIPFYNKCGFYLKGMEMRKDLNANVPV